MAWVAGCRRSPTAAAGKAGRQTARCFCLLTLFNLVREAVPTGACLRSSTALLIFFKNPDLRATLVVLQLRFSIDVYVAFQYHFHADIDFFDTKHFDVPGAIVVNCIFSFSCRFFCSAIPALQSQCSSRGVSGAARILPGAACRRPGRRGKPHAILFIRIADH